MIANEVADEMITAAAAVLAGTPPAMMETGDGIDREKHRSGRGTVMMVEPLSAGMTAMRATDLAVGAGVDPPHADMIGTGTGNGTVSVMSATGMIGRGIGYGFGRDHLKETEIIVIGTAVEKGNVKENGIGMITVVGAPLHVLEIGTGTEIVTMIVNDLGREVRVVIVRGLEKEIETVIENDPEKGNEIAGEIAGEIANETVTGTETMIQETHAAANPHEDVPDPEQEVARARAVAPPAFSTLTVTSPQQAVEVDHRVDGYDHQTGMIVQTGTTVDGLIGISPVVLMAAENGRGSVIGTGSRNEGGTLREGGVRVAIGDGNPNDLCTCTIVC